MPIRALAGEGHERLARSDVPAVDGRALDLARAASQDSAADDGGQLIGAEADQAALVIGFRSLSHGGDRRPGAAHSPRATRFRVSCGGMPNVSMMSSATRRKSS